MNTWAPPVWAAMTTIPSRVSRILHDNLADLLQQDYAHFQGVLITLPLTNRRGQRNVTELPDWLTHQPRVRVIRPELDRGPIMKWLGPTMAELPPDAYIFICDDDQRFRHSYIRECVAALAASRAHRAFATTGTSWGLEQHFFGVVQMLWGYQGVLVPRAACDTVARRAETVQLPDCCWRIDDDVVATWLHEDGFTKIHVPSGLAGTRHEPIDGLGSNAARRASDRRCCHSVINPSTYYFNMAMSALFALVLVVLVVLLVRLGLVWWRGAAVSTVGAVVPTVPQPRKTPSRQQ